MEYFRKRKQGQEKALSCICIGDWSTRTGLGTALNYPLRSLSKRGIISPILLGIGFSGWQVFKPEEFQEFPILPIHGNITGQDCLHLALKEYEDKFKEPISLVWVDMDIQRFHYIAQPEEAYKAGVLSSEAVPFLSHKTRKFKHLAYFPVDGLCLGDQLYYKFVPIVRNIDYPITCSYWTQRAIAKDGIEVSVIPHGVDTRIFYPVDKMECRAELGLNNYGLPEDAFIVGMIGTNQRRKLFEQFIPAMAELIKQRPNVYFYMHTEFTSMYEGDHDLNHLMYLYGVNRHCISTNQWLNCTDDKMRSIYGMADVQVLLSIGEGFGIPPLYSRAMGIPCLVSDCTALSEVCSDPFEKIPVKFTYIDDTANLVRHLTDIDILVERLIDLYDNRDKIKILGADAQKFAVKNYDYEKVIIPKWEKYIKQVKIDLKKNPPAGRFEEAEEENPYANS